MSGLAAPAQGHPLESDPAHATGSLRLVAEDLSTNLTTVFGPTALAFVRLDLPARDATPERDLLRGVRVERTEPAGGAAIFIDLLERDPTGGVFVGSFGFTTGPSQAPSCVLLVPSCDVAPDRPWAWGNLSGDGRVQVVAPASALRASVTVDGVLHAHNVAWLFSQDGALCVASRSLRNCPADALDRVTSYDTVVFLKVTDPDLNAVATRRETANVTVISTSDPIGERIVVQENGGPDHKDSSTFFGTLRLEGAGTAGPTPGNGRVFVRPGDLVTIRYVDPIAADGNPHPFVRTFPFAPTATATVSQPTAHYYGCTDPETVAVTLVDVRHYCSDGATGQRGQVVVADLDQNNGDDDTSSLDDDLVDTVVAHVASSSDAGFDLTLSETSASSGVFAADFAFLHCGLDPRVPAVPACPPVAQRPAGALLVGDGDAVVASYEDPRDAGGRPFAPRPAEAIWHAATDGQVKRHPSGVLGLSETVFSGTSGARANAFVSLTDLDANTDVRTVEEILVRVKTGSDPAVGLALALRETGANTGVFQESFGFTTGATGTDRVKVADKDLVVVEYQDAAGARGAPVTVRSVPSAWRAPATADTWWSFGEYYRNGTGTFDFATGTWGAGSVLPTVARITVQDLDRDHPYLRDEVRAFLSSQSDGTDLEITLLETGRNTGQFSTEVWLSPCPARCAQRVGDSAAVPPVLPILNVAPVGADDVLRAQYVEDGNTLPAATAAVLGPTPAGRARWEVADHRVDHLAAAENPQRGMAVATGKLPGSNQDFGPTMNHTVAVYVATDNPGTVRVASTACPEKMAPVRVNDWVEGRVKFHVKWAFKDPGVDCDEAGAPEDVVFVANAAAKNEIILFHTPAGGSQVEAGRVLTRVQAAPRVDWVGDDLKSPVTSRTGYARPFHFLVENAAANLNRQARDVWEVRVCLFGLQIADDSSACAGAADTLGTLDPAGINTRGIAMVETGLDTGKFLSNVALSCVPAPGRNCDPFTSAAADDRALLLRSNANPNPPAPPANPKALLRLHYDAGPLLGGAKSRIVEAVPSPDAVIEIRDRNHEESLVLAGTGNVLKVRLLEDNNAGRVVRKLIWVSGTPPGDDALQNNFPLGVAIVPNSELIYVNVTTGPRAIANVNLPLDDVILLDTVLFEATGSGAKWLTLPSCVEPDPDTFVCGAGSAAEPIADSGQNGKAPDGFVDCDDLKFVLEPGVNLVADVPACVKPDDPLANGELTVDAARGRVLYKAPLCVPRNTTQLTKCQAKVYYQFRAGFGPGDPKTRYEYKIDDKNRIKFDAFQPKWSQVYADYTPVAITASVASTRAKDLETLSLAYVAAGPDAGSYVGYMPTVTSDNEVGKLLVKADGDVIVTTHRDLTTATGIGAGPDPADFRAVVDRKHWRPSMDAAVALTAPDYNDEVAAKAYGRFVYLRVVDADGDLGPQRDELTVRLTGLANGGDAAVARLRETGGHTGEFRGVVQMGLLDPGETPIPTDGVLEFQSPVNAQFRLSYLDPRATNGQVLSREIIRGWGPSEDAEEVAVFGKPAAETGTPEGDETEACPAVLGLPPGSPCRIYRGLNQPLYPRIRDPDADLSEGADTVRIRVSSASDSDGEVFTLRETGQQTATFLLADADVLFESGPAPVPNNGRVFVRPSDPVFLAYLDQRTTAGGAREVPWNLPAYAQPSLVWEPAFDAQVRMTFASFTGTQDEAGGGLPGVLVGGVELVDLDENRPVGDQPGSRVVNTVRRVVRTASSPGVEVALIETHAASGVFVGRFGFWDQDTSPANASDRPEAQPFSGAARVHVAEGEPVRLSHQDVNALGDARDVEAVASWVPRGAGFASFDRDVYTDPEAWGNVTVIDGSRPGTGTPRRVTVRLTSELDPDGVNVTAFETATPGAYRGAFRFNVTTSADDEETPQIRVRDGVADHIAVTYRDEQPAGLRSSEALVLLGDLLPPVLGATVTPPVPDGANGWYLDSPLVTFATNEAADVRISVDGGSPFLWNGTPLLVPDGTHRIVATPVDETGNEGELLSLRLRVDVADPTEAPGDATASLLPGGKVRVAWTNGTPPADFDAFLVFRGGVPVGNSTTSDFEDAPVEDGLYSYTVAQRALSGRVGPPSAPTLAVLADRTAPRLEALVLSPDAFDVREGVDEVSLSVRVPDSDVAEVAATISPAFGSVSLLNLTRGSDGSYGATLPVPPALAVGTYAVQVQARDAAGNAGTLTAMLRVTGPDTTPPAILATESAAVLIRGASLRVQVSDNRGLAEVSYALDDGPRVPWPLGPSPPSHVEVLVPTADLASGPHAVVVSAVDLADEGRQRSANLTVTFTVRDPPVRPPATLFLPTHAVAQKDGAILVTWAFPEDLGGKTVARYVVWRSASPFVRLAEVPADGAQYLDAATDPGVAYLYRVTWVAEDGYGEAAAVEDVPGFDAEAAALPGAERVTSESQGFDGERALRLGYPLLVVFLGAALAAALAWQRRRRNA